MVDLLALGIVRRDDEILLVQQGHSAGGSYWVLPGGLVEPGELLSEALAREVREESGVAVGSIRHLACMTQIDRPYLGAQTIASIFEIGAWSGELGSDDPDNEILDVAFVPLADVLTRLQGFSPWRGMREPILAYLSGHASPGSVWFYRQESATSDQICQGSIPNPW
jgi:8-oxo-dGTP diphosphatase